MEPEAIAGFMVVAGVLGALAGLWASEREIEALEDRLLEIERELYRAQLDNGIDKIEKEGV